MNRLELQGYKLAANNISTNLLTNGKHTLTLTPQIDTLSSVGCHTKKTALLMMTEDITMRLILFSDDASASV